MRRVVGGLPVATSRAAGVLGACVVRRHRSNKRAEASAAGTATRNTPAVVVGPSPPLSLAGGTGVPSSACNPDAAETALRALLAAGVSVYRGATHEARDSFFVGHAAYPLQSPAHVALFRAYVNAAIESAATHGCMLAWSLPPATNNTSIGSDDGAMMASDDVIDALKVLGLPADGGLAWSGSDDDGEKGAGRRMAATLAGCRQLTGVGAAVAVSRWYGGVLLGGKRFELIARCVDDVLPRAP